MFARLAALALAVLVVVAASTLLGPTWPTWAELVGPWRGDAAGINPFWEIRVPRTALAALAGAGLAVGGAIFQVLFRNPLAEPYTLGIASGASLAAAAGYLTGVSGSVAGVPYHVLLALCGAAGAMALVWLVARLRPGHDMTRLLLAGVCVAFFCAAGILLVTFLANQAVTNEIVIWLMGSLGVHRPQAALEVGAVLALVVTYAVVTRRALDLLSLGDELAASRGVAVRATVWTSFVLVGMLTAVIVANCGPIGFVGLMIPHIGRVFFGVRTLPLVLGAALLGAGFLTVCDGIGRIGLSLVYGQPVGYELPVGIITNILGAGFFFYLLATRETLHTEAR